MKIVAPDTKYSHDYGDFIYGTCEILGKFNKDYLNKKLLHLAWFSPNTWYALENIGFLGIDGFVKTVKYQCPYTKIKYFAVAPIAIASDDIAKYFNVFDFKPFFQDMVLDQDYMNKLFPVDNPTQSLTDVMMSALGPGYTDFCGFNDGDSSIDLSVLKVDNGDHVICANKVWHNK